MTPCAAAGKADSASALEDALQLACDVVAAMDPPSVRSTRVIMGRRLTSSELLRAQAIAADRGVRLTMNGQGMVAVRRLESTTVATSADAQSSPDRLRALRISEMLRRVGLVGPRLLRREHGR